MSGAPLVATSAGIAELADAGSRRALGRVLPGEGAWELELGFGKGRFLLARAVAQPERRFLGIEVAGEYFRLAASRLARRRLSNVALLQGDALALLATALPERFAELVHVYFPDPWPKSRHARRRIFSPGSIDLVLGALAPSGRLEFATDHPVYGAEVEALLRGVPRLAVRRIEPGWPEGPRTNYEAKYVAEGRPIVRLEARFDSPAKPFLHPAALDALAVAVASSPRPPAGFEDSA